VVELQEMEVGTKQSKTAVNANAKQQNQCQAYQEITPGQTGWEDLGGPTPENYKSDDDSAKLKTPGATLKQVKDVVNKGAKAAEPMKGMKEEEELERSSKKKKKMRRSRMKEESEEEEEVVEEKYDIEEDVNALLAGEELSEEFQEKAKHF
jgi:acyl-CoA thioesterase